MRVARTPLSGTSGSLQNAESGPPTIGMSSITPTVGQVARMLAIVDRSSATTVSGVCQSRAATWNTARSGSPAHGESGVAE